MSNKYHLHFDPVVLAADTADAYSSKGWTALCRLLEKRGFNRFEAESILRSKHTRWAQTELPRQDTSTSFGRYLDRNNIVPGCKEVNALVLGTFSQFEANAEGVPCERGTMPGNPEAGETLVPVGTPACCNPHREQYWSM
jgi:hypothetical protein